MQMRELTRSSAFCIVLKNILGYGALLVCIIWITYYHIIILQAKLLQKLPDKLTSSLNSQQNKSNNASISTFYNPIPFPSDPGYSEHIHI